MSATAQKSRPFRLTPEVKPEHVFQAEACRALRILLPRDAFVTAIDHAHKKDALTGAILKGRGAVSGLPDLWVVVSGRLYCLELKRRGGQVSETQRECHALLRQAGVDVAVCRSLDEVVAALRGWALPLRGRIAA
jgi:hypothetical protein